MSHPNTTAAGLTSLAGAALVYALNTWAGTHLNAVDGTVVAGAGASAVLFVGRRGIKRTLQGIWDGSEPEREPLGVSVLAASEKMRGAKRPPPK